jgi:tRNA(fMet)-specific endonuclease VapC
MYLLDTNICIYVINKKPKEILEKFKTLDISEVKLSSITIAEMEYGAVKSAFPAQNRAALLNFKSSLEIIPFDAHDAEVFGVIRADLERRGKMIGPYDLMLAAQALSRGLVFVTNNTAEFERVNGLRLENWVS